MQSIAHSSSGANNRVWDEETYEADGEEEEEKVRQSKEDLVQQADHSNTDLFTD